MKNFMIFVLFSLFFTCSMQASKSPQSDNETDKANDPTKAYRESLPASSEVSPRKVELSKIKVPLAFPEVLEIQSATSGNDKSSGTNTSSTRLDANLSVQAAPANSGDAPGNDLSTSQHLSPRNRRNAMNAATVKIVRNNKAARDAVAQGQHEQKHNNKVKDAQHLPTDEDDL